MIEGIMDLFPRWHTMYQLSFLAITVIGLIVFKRLIRRVQRSELDMQAAHAQGELIYVDEGSSVKPFFNKQFKVLGKPDAIYQSGSTITAVEYKSRQGAVKKSDIVQAMTAALAARGDKFKVTHVLVITKRERKVFTLPKSDQSLYELIKMPIQKARQVKQGEICKAHPNDRKCTSCAYYTVCDYTD